MIKSTIYLQELSSEGNFQYTHPEEIENRVKEIAAKENVKLYGTKLVGFTPDEAYRRAVNALVKTMPLLGNVLLNTESEVYL